MAAEGQKPMVEYNFLSPNCGIKVSNICLGTMTYGENKALEAPGLTNEADSHKILDRFYELGGNFIDTANVYNNGTSESIIGTWMKKLDRSEIILATKVRFGINPKNFNTAGLSRGSILNNLDQSLKRLQTDYIDLYYSHCWDSATKLEETLQTFNDCVRSGKVRYVGVSNVTGAQLQKIAAYNKFMGFNQVVALQAEYNLGERGIEMELDAICEEEGISIVPYGPLKGGLLTGKFKREDTVKSLSGTRLGWTAEKPEQRTMGVAPYVEQYRNNEDYWKLMDLMQAISKTHGKTVTEVAVRWCLQKKIVSSVIIGPKTLQQLDGNMGAGTGWQLTEDEMKQLDEASAFAKAPNFYPFTFVNRMNHGRKN